MVRTIGELFLLQADRTPEAPAVTCADRTLTYAELRSSANRLGRELRQRGVGPEVTVGVCMHRSVELVVALLAIVVAGGAYVPLDPDLPADRMAGIVSDAGASLVITSAQVAERVAAGRTPVLCADRDSGVFQVGDGADLEHAAQPGNLLYVIYTSGSTGRPKGVMVRHSHVADYVTWCLENLPLGPGASVPLTSSVSFAGVTLALFGSLVSGRRLVVPDPDDLFSWCASPDDYSFVKLTPSSLRYAHHRFGRCWDRWGCIILASEPVRSADWQLAGADGTVPVVVHYGATETSGSTVWWPAAGASGASRGLPVGRAVSTTEVLILDQWGDPAPPGVPGEIFVGGPSIARGYLGQPALTAERFVPHPSGAPGARLFRTGDLGLLDADGGLVFLGRADRQVKIRGYRVELDDVELELKALDGVDDAAAAAEPDDDGGRVLTAYLSTRPGHDLSAHDIRAALGRRLPGYMIPSRFAFTAALPRTSSGKIDREALAAIPVAADADGGQPATDMERLVARTWAELLPVSELSRDANFFAIGGHSLLAIQVVSILGEKFGVEIPVQVIFEAPTVAGFAERVEQARDAGAQSFSSR